MRKHSLSMSKTKKSTWKERVNKRILMNCKPRLLLMYGDTVGVMGLAKMYVTLHSACEAAINMGREAFNADKDVQLDILPKIIVKTKECNENMKSFIAQYK